MCVYVCMYVCVCAFARMCVCVSERECVCVCVVGAREGSWVIVSTALSSSGIDGRIAVMI